MTNKKAIVLGAVGADGSYMSELLHSKGYEVHGIVRENTSPERIEWIKKLVPNISIYKINVLNKAELSTIINVIRPNEIYNFLGVSNVFDPWSNLDEIMDLNARVPQYILEIIVAIDKSIRFFQASSCLVFGRTISIVQNELTPRKPIYAYGCAKNYTDNLIKEFRKTFGIFACSGIMYPHESERRGLNFLTQKVSRYVAMVAEGKTNDKLTLGDLSQSRDYSYAPDVVEAAWMMLQHDNPEDFVIGSGNLTKTEDFVRMAFDFCCLNYKDHVKYDEGMIRKNDVTSLCADTTKIKNLLGWSAKYTVNDIAKFMVNYQRLKIMES